MRIAVAIAGVVSLVVCTSVAAAGLDANVQLGYTFAQGDSADLHLAAKIEGLEMGGGLPLAVTGTADVDMGFEVIAVADDGIATVRMSFGQVSSQFMGKESIKDAPPPVDLSVDGKGRAVPAAGATDGKFDLLASGGVPVELLSLLAGVVELPEGQVALGEEWVTSSEVSAPGIGAVTIAMTSQLVEVGVDTVTITSAFEAKLPDFTTSNPMGEGDTQITQAVLTMDDLTRVLDARTGLVRSASGSLVLSCTANLGGMGEVPLKVLSSFTLGPREGEQAVAAPGVITPDAVAAGTEIIATLMDTVLSRLSQYFQTR